MSCVHHAIIEKYIRVKTVGLDLACIPITSIVATRASPCTTGLQLHILGLQACYVHSVTIVVESFVAEVTKMLEFMSVTPVAITLACASSFVRVALWLCIDEGGHAFHNDVLDCINEAM